MSVSYRIYFIFIFLFGKLFSDYYDIRSYAFNANEMLFIQDKRFRILQRLTSSCFVVLVF